MSRTPLIAGNWKMHLTVAESVALARAVAEAAARRSDREVMIAPPATALFPVAGAVKGTGLILAGQNVAWEEKGAFTGEISPAMLRDCGCAMAIVGHSERRHIFGEDDAMINRRLKGALAHGLTPVLCVGETLEEREAGRTAEVIEGQLRAGLAGARVESGRDIVVAYEPVWAIGTGRTATSGQAQEVHERIRALLGQMFEKGIAAEMRILYGGSVKPGNAAELVSQPDIDGALVGGASLDAESFAGIINA
jgi:triosephosphate isomerase